MSECFHNFYCLKNSLANPKSKHRSMHEHDSVKFEWVKI